MDRKLQRWALISVSDKSGLRELAEELVNLEIGILTTGGSSKILQDSNIPFTEVSKYTGHPEIMGGRVKTLHPKIHGGEGLAQSGIDRVTGDQMGMLATIINALAIQDALERQGMYARVMSALKVNEVCEDYIRRRATRHLEKGRITIFAAGTGNPYFTTDSAASLRAVEIEADLLIKATRVNGVYSDDPLTNTDAKHYEEISYSDFISMGLKVMDTTSIVMCRDNNLPVRVYDMGIKGALQDIVEGKNVGTLIG